VTDRERRARQVAQRWAWWSAGAALIPVPVADLIVVTGAQLKMLTEISGIYGVSFERIRARAILGSLAGYVLQPTLSVGLAGVLLKAIPGAGALLGAPSLALFAGAYAWALGRVFIQHFEAGGTFLDFDPEAARQRFQAQFAEGRRRLER
jgi:uncharacterized protein (DUF697 family)